jgi:hypothetical protein
MPNVNGNRKPSARKPRRKPFPELPVSGEYRAEAAASPYRAVVTASGEVLPLPALPLRELTRVSRTALAVRAGIREAASADNAAEALREAEEAARKAEAKAASLRAKAEAARK